MRLWSWLTGYDEQNAEAAAAADARIQEINARNQYYQTPENQNILAQNRETELTDLGGGYDVASESGAIDKEFSKTLDSRAQSLIGGPLEGARKVVAAILKAVPWWVWLGLAVGLFAWLGGFVLLRGVLAKGKSK